MSSPTAERRWSGPEVVILGGLIGGGVGGLLTVNADNVLPVSGLLYAAVVIGMALSASRMRAAVLPIVVLAASYVTLKALLVLAGKPANVYDFTQAHLAYIYLIPIALFAGSQVFDKRAVATTVSILVPMFAAKYAVVRVLGNGSREAIRPGLYTENNYELLLLIGLFYLARNDIRRRPVILALLACVVLIGSSRSATVEFAIMLAFMYLRNLRHNLAVYVISAGLAVAMVYSVFRERVGSGGVQSIDRYRFYQAFLRETSDWSLTNWLLGAYPITPLSNATCQRFQYYEMLFSHGDPDVCYSVILHSFAMRVLFDQGLLGLALLLGLLWWALRIAGTTAMDRCFLIAIGVANAMSVSAFNSQYMLVLLVIWAGTRHRDPVADRGRPDIHRIYSGLPREEARG